MNVDALLERLTGVRGSGKGWVARCPAHDDQRASLSVSSGDDGRILLHCHAGCAPGAVAGAIGIEVRELFPNGRSARNGPRPQGPGNIIAEYDYADEAGALLYQVVRLQPKDFRIRHRNGAGGWTWKLPERLVLYRLPEVLAAVEAGRTVYVCEGEKDCDRLAAAGFTATTNAMGAGKWRPEYLDILGGAIVCIVPDNDEPGREHAQAIAAAVTDVAAEVRILGLPDLPEKGDVSDWLEAGHDVAELAELAFRAPLYERGSGLGEWDAGDDVGLPPPRGWLLGNIFCRRFVSSLLADGGVGKTALRIAQLVACATGRPLTGEHVFQRCRVLIVQLEDDVFELRRRILAVRLKYDIPLEELKGWLFLATPDRAAGKLMVEHDGSIVRSALADRIEAAIIGREIDVVSLDPFVKAHAVEENSNNAVDAVIQLLADLASKHDIAVDVPHHTSKGLAEPGNANRGRGASAMKDGARLVYTLSPMSTEEAEMFGIKDDERRRLIRMDSGKVNITPSLTNAKWFRLLGVELGNATELYPHGDEVQTVEPWEPPNTWGSMSADLLNRILDAIDAGLDGGVRYTDAPSARSRAAWKAVTEHAPHKTEKQAREMIRTWVRNGVLVVYEYRNEAARKTESGLRVESTKRPR